MPGPFDAPEVTVTCKDGGTWEYPEKWPHCVDSELNDNTFKVETFNTEMSIAIISPYDP